MIVSDCTLYCIGAKYQRVDVQNVYKWHRSDLVVNAASCSLPNSYDVGLFSLARGLVNTGNTPVCEEEERGEPDSLLDDLPSSEMIYSPFSHLGLSAFRRKSRSSEMMLLPVLAILACPLFAESQELCTKYGPKWKLGPERHSCYLYVNKNLTSVAAREYCADLVWVDKSVLVLENIYEDESDNPNDNEKKVTSKRTGK
ncbi:hypothetical protein ScPMuIL_000249 [Solemya velum]